jgi:hypothetical protein
VNRPEGANGDDPVAPLAPLEPRDPRDPRLVPVYAITRGRTRSTGEDLPWETLVNSTKAGMSSLPRLRFEQARIVRYCRTPVSVAEVAVELKVPLGVARVLVSDLNTDGMLSVHRPNLTDAGRPSTEILERLLAGLKAHQ